MSHPKVANQTHIGSDVPDEVAFPLLVRKLWEHTLITESGCWQWKDPGKGQRYVQIFFRNERWRIHRLSFHIHKGPIPEGHHVLHHCDNPLCWRPDHLWSGTDKDNMQDCSRKGRCGNRFVRRATSKVANVA